MNYQYSDFTGFKRSMPFSSTYESSFVTPTKKEYLSSAQESSFQNSAQNVDFKNSQQSSIGTQSNTQHIKTNNNYSSYNNTPLMYNNNNNNNNYNNTPLMYNNINNNNNTLMYNNNNNNNNNNNTLIYKNNNNNNINNNNNYNNTPLMYNNINNNNITPLMHSNYNNNNHNTNSNNFNNNKSNTGINLLSSGKKSENSDWTIPAEDESESEIPMVPSNEYLQNFGNTHNQKNLRKYVKNESTLMTLQKKGITYLYPVQEYCFQGIESGLDIFATEKSGNGKTIAYVLPFLEKFRNQGLFKELQDGQGPLMVILLPFRETIVRIANEIRSLMNYPNEFRVVQIDDRLKQPMATKQLQKGTEILVGSPIGLANKYMKGKIDFSQLKALVIDKFDTVRSSGLSKGMMEITEFVRVDKAQNSERQQNIFIFAKSKPSFLDFAKRYMHSNYVEINLIKTITEKESQQQSMMTHFAIKNVYLQRGEMITDVMNYYCSDANSRVIIFTGSKLEVDDLLLCANFSKQVNVIHEQMSENEIEVLIMAFRAGRIKCLMVTDLAKTEQLSLPAVELIIQAHPPKDYRMYMKRICKAGGIDCNKSCVSVTLFSNNEFQFISHIEVKNMLTLQPMILPERKELIRASSDSLKKNLSAVTPYALEMSRSIAIAKSLVEESGVQESVLSVTAPMTGFGKMKERPRSLLSQKIGFATYLMRSKSGKKWVGNASRFLNQILTQKHAKKIQGMRMFQDGKGVLFDVVEADKNLFDSKILTQDYLADFRLELAREVPPLKPKKKKKTKVVEEKLREDQDQKIQQQLQRQSLLELNKKLVENQLLLSQQNIEYLQKQHKTILENQEKQTYRILEQLDTFAQFQSNQFQIQQEKGQVQGTQKQTNMLLPYQPKFNHVKQQVSPQSQYSQEYESEAENENMKKNPKHNSKQKQQQQIGIKKEEFDDNVNNFQGQQFQSSDRVAMGNHTEMPPVACKQEVKNDLIQLKYESIEQDLNEKPLRNIQYNQFNHRQSYTQPQNNERSYGNEQGLRSQSTQSGNQSKFNAGRPQLTTLFHFPFITFPKVPPPPPPTVADPRPRREAEIYIGGIQPDCLEDEVISFFEQNGVSISTLYPVDGEEDDFRGGLIGICHSHLMALNAVQLNGIRFQGHALTVIFASQLKMK